MKKVVFVPPNLYLQLISTSIRIGRSRVRFELDEDRNGATGWLTGARIAREVAAGSIIIDPFSSDELNPNSYNYTLDSRLLRLENDIIDMRGPDAYEELEIPAEGIVIQPGECYLGATAQTFGSACFASLVTGRSSVGRKFITNHITAGLIDIGFVGQITLEITVQRPTRIYSNLAFGQIYWFSVFGPIEHQYSGKYQGQVGPTTSRLWKDLLTDERGLATFGIDALSTEDIEAGAGTRTELAN
jgi:dCTP deaminase